MDNQSAAENLQLIRTLMERSALYRRALAPIMLLTGAIGTAGAIVGMAMRVESMHPFCRFWLAVGIVAMTGTLAIARRQSLKTREPVLSPPARRVVLALFPTLLLGGSLGLGMFELSNDEARQFLMVPVIWIALYGCALNAAGHFTARGLRWFGLTFALPACAVLPFSMRPAFDPPWHLPHLIMGVWFGLFHLLFGAYLFVTEKKETSA